MAVRSVFWPNNVQRQDIHLYAGTISPRLDHLLRIEDGVTNPRADSPPAGVTVSFAGAPAVAGVAVNPTNGEVNFPSSAAGGSGWPRRIVVTCTVTEGGNPFTTQTRVVLHASISQIWLTPARFNAAGVATSGLTVRNGARGNRFSVLAKFDDDEIASLANWCPLIAPAPADRTFVRVTTDNATPAIVWSGTGAGMTVDPQTGILTCTSDAASVTVTAAIKPLLAVAHKQASAPAVGAAAWSTAVPLTLIQGPGFGKMADATTRNILILPDGFDASQRAAFESLVRNIVSRVTTRAITRPYDLLKDKFNYFMAWVESPEAAISVWNELQLSNVSGNNADGTEYGMGAPPAIADRCLVNDRNTAFHTVMGLRPAADFFGTQRHVHFNPLRIDTADFELFLTALANPAGAAVGSVWAQGGKDEALVAILCRSVRVGGSNNFRGTGRCIAMTLERRPNHRLRRISSGSGFDLLDTAFNVARARIECWTTLAHEVAHSFRIEDEYGGIPAAVPISAGVQPIIDDSFNTQRRDTLLTMGGNLDADKIKWRWLRLEKVGVLAAPPGALTATTFRCALVVGQAAAFARDDIVRLRTKNLLPLATYSDRLKVTDVAGDEVEVELVPGGAAPAVAAFPAGSVLVAPKRAAAVPPALGADLELVHATIRARINATSNPLNDVPAVPAVPNRACTTGSVGIPTRATNFPGSAPRPPTYTAWLVGLFESGRLYDCNVYHPTGICAMRALTFTEKAAGGATRVYQFCPVCRYAMVDQIDPSKHGAIDLDYDPRYPL